MPIRCKRCRTGFRPSFLPLNSSLIPLSAVNYVAQPVRLERQRSVQSGFKEPLEEAQYDRPHARIEPNTFEHQSQAILERVYNALRQFADRVELLRELAETFRSSIERAVRPFMTALGPRTERLASMLGLAMKLVETLKKQVDYRKSDVVGVDQGRKETLRIAQCETAPQNLRMATSMKGECKP